MGKALESAIYELPHLGPLYDDIAVVGGPKLAAYIRHFSKVVPVAETLRSILSLLPVTDSEPMVRKLAAFGDKEGKTRIVGICDYWTQAACKPLHEALARILRALETDCTFNQQKASEASAFLGPYYSYDLTSVTDRMPLFVQRRIVASIIGVERADS